MKKGIRGTSFLRPAVPMNTIHSDAMTETKRSDLPLYLLLIAASIALALLIGDIGFQGDDWWIFSFPYWNGFWDSVARYASESRRPVEGIYWTGMFDLFGLWRVPYSLCSFLLLAGSCMVMAACLTRAFPGYGAVAVSAAIFSFFLPSTACLAYMIHTDNSRISSLLFWASVLAFQAWAGTDGRGGRGKWVLLGVGVVLYFIAALTYENAVLQIFAVPLLVWPVLKRSRDATEARSGLIFVGCATSAAFCLFLLSRFLVFGGGAVGHGSLFPSLHNAVSYGTTFGRYLAAPFSELSGDAWSWGFGLLVGGLSFLLIWSRFQGDRAGMDLDGGRDQSPWYVMFVGLCMMGLGIAPYLMAGYSAGLGFTSQSRIYSSGGFGAATIVGLVLFAWGGSRCSRMARAMIGGILIVCMAVFSADLRRDWQDAAGKRREIEASLARQVPAVAPGTTFLFLDLQWYLSDKEFNRAVVFQGVDGLPEFIKMMYREKRLYAYFLYPFSQRMDDTEGRIAVVSPQGLTARGSAPRGPIPPDSVLILERKGSRLHLLDRLTEDQPRAAIKWNGVSTIRSNLDLIRPRADPLN